MRVLIHCLDNDGIRSEIKKYEEANRWLDARAVDLGRAITDGERKRYDANLERLGALRWHLSMRAKRSALGLTPHDSAPITATLNEYQPVGITQ